MKNTLSAILFSLCFSNAIGQSKTVKLIIDSSKIYLSYFYNIRRSTKTTVNDSISLRIRKKSSDDLYVDKFVKGKRIWTRSYHIELAKDSLHITTRILPAIDGRKFIHSKERYYNGILVEEGIKE